MTEPHPPPPRRHSRKTLAALFILLASGPVANATDPAAGSAPAADVPADPQLAADPTFLPMPKETDWVDTSPQPGSPQPASPQPASPQPASLQPGSVPTPGAPPSSAADAAPAAPPADTTLDANLPKPTVPAVADPLAPLPGSEASAPAPTIPNLPPTGPNFADLPAPAPALRVANPSLRDTATLVADGKELVLYGIEGRGGDDAAMLQNYIASAGGVLDCKAEEGDRQVCTLPDGTDIAKVALVNGIASYALGGPQAYKDEQEDAQKARRGLWADLPPLPPQLDHPTMPDTATLRGPNGEIYRLDGIEGVAGPMAGVLQAYIAANGDTVQCQPQSSDSNVCILRDSTDIAKVALVNGLARTAATTNDDYRIEQDAAKANRRGVWAGLSSDAAAAAGQDMARLQHLVVASVNVPGDGITVVDGQPTMIVEGAPVFMVLAGAAGWGYWDHERRWHGAPEGFSHRVEALHPRGEGLRGWSNPGVRMAMASARPAEFGRGAPVAAPRGTPAFGVAGRPVMGGGLPGGARPGAGAGGAMSGIMRAPISGAGFARPGVPAMRPGAGAPAFGGMRAPAFGGMQPGMRAPAFAGTRPGMGAPAFGGARPGGFAPRPVAMPRPAPARPMPPHR